MTASITATQGKDMRPLDKNTVYYIGIVTLYAIIKYLLRLGNARILNRIDKQIRYCYNLAPLSSVKEMYVCCNFLCNDIFIFSSTATLKKQMSVRLSITFSGMLLYLYQ